MRHFFTLFCFCLFGFSASSATLSSANQTIPLDFGNIDPVSGGNIAACVASGPKILSGCVNGVFAIAGEDSIGANSTTFKVFITNADSALTSGGSSANVSFSLSSSSSVSSQTFDLPAGAGTKSLNVPIYGTLSLGNVATQASGTYSGNYTIVACSCNDSGCPTSSTDPLCS